jgi:hypothetical protein
MPPPAAEGAAGAVVAAVVAVVAGGRGATFFQNLTWPSADAVTKNAVPGAAATWVTTSRCM